MKQFLLYILLCLPVTSVAQSEWHRAMTPEERLAEAKREEAAAKKAIKDARRAEKAARRQAKTTGQPIVEPTETTEAAVNAKDAPYIGKDIVPEVDGKVVFTFDENIKGWTADSIYQKAYWYLDSLSTADEQIESSIVAYNEGEHVVAARYNEWLTFSKNILSIDRTRLKYTIIAQCSDEHLHLTIERLSYAYEERRDTPMYVTAEEWITDEKAVNKKGTALRHAPAKFRRSTVDRVNELFKGLRTNFFLTK